MSKVNSKPTSDWNAEQTACNSISILDANDTEVASVTCNDDDVTDDHWKTARLIEMAPALLEVAKLGNTYNKDRVQRQLDILNYIKSGKTKIV